MTTLIVDLDGTILRSDMLHETFWSAFAKDWRTPFRAVAALMKGRAALKRYLAGASSVNVTNLPYDEDILAYVRNWRAERGEVVLVTATDQQLAQEIATHLNLFDGVHGSDGETNLKSQHKAAFLRERYGSFAYIGDAVADIPVWSEAAKAITVNASTSLQQATDEVATETEHLHTKSRGLRPYVKALRPHQWLKNCLVFLPLLVAHQITPASSMQALLAFVSFSLIASSVYVVNDLLDLRADRAHVRKCKRPFASGLVPLAHGPWIFVVLLLLGLLVALALGTEFLLVMLGYYALTLAYSLSLKRRAIVDICSLAGLYTLRVIAGGAATGIALSIWLLAFSIFLFFSLACVKRQAELVLSSTKAGQRIEGRGYQTEDREIISMMAMSSGYISVLVLALYLNSDAVQQLYAQPFYLWGTCCVLLYWVSRNVLLAHRGHMHDDPVIFAIKDRPSLLCGALILSFALAGVLL